MVKTILHNHTVLNPETLQTGSSQNSKYLIWQDSRRKGGGGSFVWNNYVRMKLK